MKLKITLAVAALVALLVAPQAAAGPGKGVANRATKAACEADLAELGRDAFRDLHDEGAQRGGRAGRPSRISRAKRV